MSLGHRAWLWLKEQVAFVAVLVVLAVAFGYLVVDSGRWGRATGIIAVAVLFAGVLRAVVPDARVGLLAVRGRVVDSVCSLVLGGVLLGVDIRLHG